MRLLVYFLSCLIVFFNIQVAHASVSISKAQIVQMGKKGGAFVKTHGGKVFKLSAVGVAYAGTQYAISWCAKYPKKCRDYIGDAVEFICEINECTVSHKDDDDDEYIGCTLYIGHDGEYGEAVSMYTRLASREVYNDGKMVLSPHPDAYKLINEYKKRVNDPDYPKYEQMTNVYNTDLPVYLNNLAGTFRQETKYGFSFYVKCDKKSHKKGDLLSDDELEDIAEKIINKMDKDDIKNYYNTEYEDITINNKHYYSYEINNETDIEKQCNDNACNEISQEIEEDLRKGKYDIDDVNKDNCTMEENTGKYIACYMTINQDNDQDDTTPPSDGNDKPDKSDDDPLSCTYSPFHKKVCDWIDWTQEDLDNHDDNTKAKVTELDDELRFDSNRVHFGRACPSGDTLSVSFAGVSVSHTISYEGLCDAFAKMRPFVVGIGAMVSVMIVGGRRV